MIHHTMLFTPFRLPAGALEIMAFFRTDNAGVTLRQFRETRIAVALTKTLVTAPATMNTVNCTAVLNT